MNQIVRHFGLSSYPATVEILNTAEHVFLSAIRGWVADFRVGEDPLPRLCRSMQTIEAPDAAYSVDRFMALVARTARQPILIRCPHCPILSEDEKHLLFAASLTQADASDLAESALRTTLLSARGAEFVVGPLEEITEQFFKSGLILARRRSPAEAPPPLVETWTPPIGKRIIH